MLMICNTENMLFLTQSTKGPVPIKASAPQTRLSLKVGTPKINSTFDHQTNYGRSTPQVSPDPPRYSEIFSSKAEMERSWYDPRGWSSRKKWIIGACVVVVIVAVIVGAVEGVKANAYPNYSQLNYTLADTYSGSSFFDDFEYYTSADPTNGWVQYV